MPAPPHVILGQPWLRIHCPEVVDLLAELGPTIIADDWPETILSLPVKSLALAPSRGTNDSAYCSGTVTPIALPPSKDPVAAFSAGGDFSLLCALEAEEHRRKDCENKFITCMTARYHVDNALFDKMKTRRLFASLCWQKKTQEPKD